MANQTAPAVVDDDVRICEPGGSGLFLPIGGEAELNWNPRLKVVLYGIGLVYCFLGVSIAADMFMAAIERITSKQKKVRVPGSDRFVTVQVWNETVANLTLMALGSSAPEILLSLNDVFKNDFFEGKLGPSTIVGSAAFNLHVIIAVCVNSIPNGEVRTIKERGVFLVTAGWSIFAYVWLLFIVHYNTKDVIEVWEGCMTFVYFPILVVMSYATDNGWFGKDSLKEALWPNQVEDEDGAGGSRPASLGGGIRGVAASTVRCCLCTACCCCPGPLRRAVMSMAPKAEDGSEEEIATLTDEREMESTIMDDEGKPVECEAGVMSFKYDTLQVHAGEDERKYTVTVYRRNGDLGRVTVKYSMVSLTAIPGYDYEEEEDELTFRDSVMEQDIEFTILPKAHGEKHDKFQIVIEDETGTVQFNPNRDGGEEKNILTVHINNENPRPRTIGESMKGSVDGLVNLDELRLGAVHWKEQIMEAVYCNGSREEQDNASIQDWILHMIWVPWKVPLAVGTPPPMFLGGWVCFGASLIGIGILTVIVGDLAELLGCSLGIPDAITAISIVALGTSVPDLFASRSAAKEDEYADASIVNVTGSNSVNVFLGIGLPWMTASLYWFIAGANEQWTHRYGPAFGAQWGQNGGAVFIVRSGQIFFSVAVFTLTAIICLTCIVLRRRWYGGELGGPSDPKAYSSALLIMLWLMYIGLSTWSLYTQTEDFTTQMIAIGISLPVLIIAMVMFACLLRALKFSKKYIGEEGFWGILVATVIIGGRIIIFFVFQYQ